MITHHPEDDLLLDFASGHPAAGPRLVVAAHIEICAQCRQELHLLNAVGGAILEEIEPVRVSERAFAATLAAVDRLSAVAPSGSAAAATMHHPQLPGNVAWPRALRHCSATDWRWLGPGMRWSRVSVPHDRAANVFLLRIGAGKMLPMHTHSDLELTQVLYGTFHDGRALFEPGDFDGADGSIVHQPVVQPGTECVCLAAVSGKVLFKSAMARVFGSLVGM